MSITLAVFDAGWPVVAALAVSYFAAVQVCFYLSSFTTLTPVAAFPVIVETIRSPTQLSLDLFALVGVTAGTSAVSVVFGRSVVEVQLLPLAVTLAFLFATWLVVTDQRLGEQAIWYYLLATPVAGGVAVASLCVGY